MSEETVLPWFEGERRPWPPLEELRAQHDAARRERDELRAVLRRYTDIVLLDAKTYTAKYPGVHSYADAMDEFYRAARAVLGDGEAPT